MAPQTNASNFYSFSATIVSATALAIVLALITINAQAQDEHSIETQALYETKPRDTKQYETKQEDAKNQYRTALFTALSAAEVSLPDMASFANQQLHQATYCLMLINPEPMQTIAQLTQEIVVSPLTRAKLTDFEKIKNHFDVEEVRTYHPCINNDFPADAILASR